VAIAQVAFRPVGFVQKTLLYSALCLSACVILNGGSQSGVSQISWLQSAIKSCDNGVNNVVNVTKD
jgi:hypothetical protein